MTQVLSINDTVTVILTYAGAQFLREKRPGVGYAYGQSFTCTLYELMAEFGQAMNEGRLSPFKDGMITKVR